MRIISFILFIGLINSCSSSKKMSETDYTYGTVVYSAAENDCAYSIKVDTQAEDLFYDPVNLENEFIKDGLKIKFHFKALRMKSRCNKANPISLTYIKKQ